MLTKNKICFFSSLAMGLALTMPIKAAAETEKITNLTEFYEYYGSDFTSGQQDIIKGIFDNINPYLQPNGAGLQNAIDDGFIPLTPEWIDHGIHWFNPTLDFVDLTNMQANPLKPSGLNMSKDGELLGVFWAEELYNPPLFESFQSLQQSGQLATLTPEQLTQVYTQQTAEETPVPTDFDAFSDIGWHKHKNVIIEGLGTRNEQGNLDPQQVDFRQSLSNENFIGEVLASIVDPSSILSPLEIDPSSLDPNSAGYPQFNRGVSGGFHMLHMWVGQGNKAGLFAGTNQSIEVSNMAIDESETFEDGTDGHGHGMEGGDHHGEHSQSVPEPSFVVAMLGSILLSAMNKIKKHSTAIH